MKFYAGLCTRILIKKAFPVQMVAVSITPFSKNLISLSSFAYVQEREAL